MTNKIFLSRVQVELMDNGKTQKVATHLTSKNLAITDLAIKLYLR
ncbi:Uncharacterised protein [Vibrio parahaemolyticus]|nr:Uncharacterised protein [Vibrio parahaemolyticus]